MAGTVGLSLWHLMWRLAGRPAWLIDSQLNGLWLFMIVLGGMFLLAAPGAIEGHIPRRNQMVLGIVAGMFYAARRRVSGSGNMVGADVSWCAVTAITSRLARLVRVDMKAPVFSTHGGAAALYN